MGEFWPVPDVLAYHGRWRERYEDLVEAYRASPVRGPPPRGCSGNRRPNRQAASPA
ncbi:hypothetical protein SGRIM128S_02629 [Streptomyces griseomycini]